MASFLYAVDSSAAARRVIVEDPDQIEKVRDENQQLILIFGASINTAKKRLVNRKTS